MGTPIPQEPADIFAGPLVERLRSLRWPSPSEQIRKRCLEELRQELTRLPSRSGGSGGGSVFRHSFSARSRRRAA